MNISYVASLSVYQEYQIMERSNSTGISAVRCIEFRALLLNGERECHPNVMRASMQRDKFPRVKSSDQEQKSGKMNKFNNNSANYSIRIRLGRGGVDE